MTRTSTFARILLGLMLLMGAVALSAAAAPYIAHAGGGGGGGSGGGGGTSGPGNDHGGPDGGGAGIGGQCPTGSTLVYRGGTDQYTCVWTTPTSCSLTISPATVAPGQSATLSWSSTNSTSFSISPGIGSVAPNASGSRIITPSANTTYTGTAIFTGALSQTKTANCSATVSVSSGDVCPNLPGVQTTVPAGYQVSNGQCVWVVTDLCSNIPGNQTTVPSGYVHNADGTCTYGGSVCPNGSPPVNGICPGGGGVCPDGSLPANGICPGGGGDVCPNLPGVQSGVPAGYQLNNGQCVRIQNSCPTGYVMQNGVCVRETCTPAYSCNGNTIIYTNAQCQVSTVDACAMPSICVPTSPTCVTPAATIQSLTANPTLLRQGESTTLSWSTKNAASCTVSRSDTGNVISSLLQSTGLQAAVTQQTTFTLHCLSLNGGTPPFAEQNVTVRVIPKWQEGGSTQ